MKVIQKKEVETEFIPRFQRCLEINGNSIMNPIINPYEIFVLFNCYVNFCVYLYSTMNCIFMHKVYFFIKSKTVLDTNLISSYKVTSKFKHSWTSKRWLFIKIINIIKCCKLIAFLNDFMSVYYFFPRFSAMPRYPFSLYPKINNKLNNYVYSVFFISKTFLNCF